MIKLNKCTLKVNQQRQFTVQVHEQQIGRSKVDKEFNAVEPRQDRAKAIHQWGHDNKFVH